jgi:hypothetical protein
MRILPVLGFLLISSCFTLSLKANDLIKDKSPDGKFALRIVNEEDWEAAIIEVRTKKKVMDLETYGSYTKEAQLVWSKDSKRVAHFEPDRRGGMTHIYFRSGSKFQEVQFPYADIPECDAPAKQDGDEYLKTLEYSVAPVRWLKSGALVLAVFNQWLMKSGNSPECSETVTIAFDANRKASVESVKDKKLERE